MHCTCAQMLRVVMFLSVPLYIFSSFFFFNDTATTEIYTLSLHDALPIYAQRSPVSQRSRGGSAQRRRRGRTAIRSEEHTSELQSPDHLVCRLLLEKKKKKHASTTATHHTHTLPPTPSSLSTTRSSNPHSP